jgi:lactoylglutathione lyase
MNHLSRSLFRATTRLATTPTVWRGLSSSASDRPFQVLGVQQIAVGSLDKEALRHLWVDLLGCGPVQSSHRLEKENVDEDILTVGGTVEVDLMAPIDPEAKPAVHNPPLNHIGLWVDALPAAVDWLTEQGVRFTPGGIRTGAAGYDVVFIHPKSKPDAGLPYSGQGVLIELVQAPPEVIASKSK